MRTLLAALIALAVGCSDDAVPAQVWEVEEVPPSEAASDPELVPEEQPPLVAEPRDHPDTIAGVWLVEQPYHALYEATWYSFEATGSLTELESVTYGHPVPTGTVGRCSVWSPQNDDHCADFTNSGECIEYYPPYCTEWAQVSCTFGDQWWSDEEGELSILSSCSDGSIRIVLFDVSELLAGTAEAPGVVSVDGEEGWYHNTWDWRWVKCPDANNIDACHTFL